MYIRSFILLVVLFMNSLAQGQQIATPRIYYHKEELQGTPIETIDINLKNFDSILKNAQQEFYEVGQVSTTIALIDGVLESVYVDMFNYCTIRKDGITYDTDEGSFYLPEAIILYDVSDYTPFPSKFYFVAKINNQLELCCCNGGDGVKWHQLADRITIVEDMVIIKKVEDTINYLEEFLAYEAGVESATVIDNRKPLSEEKKAAYIALTELCMPESPRKEEILSFIDGLKQYNNYDEANAFLADLGIPDSPQIEGMLALLEVFNQYEDDDANKTAYNEFRMYLNRNTIPFIITVDWKESVGELEAWVRGAVEENFNKIFQFDYKGEYDENSTVSDDGLFLAFDRQLRKIDLQISMIKTDGDEYQLIVHPVHVIDKVVEAMAIMDISQDSIPD